MTKQPIDDHLARLARRFREVGVSRNTLAELAGVHRNTLFKLGKPDWEPSIATIRRLEDTLLRPTAEIRAEAIKRALPVLALRKNGARGSRVSEDVNRATANE